MDKVFMLIILLIVVFWGYLKYSEDSGNWVATGSNGVIGEYSNYTDCIEGVKLSGLNLEVEVFSCNRD
ncbi:MAG: hypothetical protein HOA86_05020 [Gammaproteobacteria bacterium]|jgi:hypothetical protein|nr:hypothetical protein [Gammaproteobacteria bacterium]MBT6755358.1 hypothetical protein [Gammaproteobacteria bacterium]MBT7523553.1 hypothetical protein [Gammaproteobacteria bacterium]MBT7814665.1 hypothetical protein [Gammaproteobacteria bacterium]MDC3386505.1 hypothetical protein [Gammaproteobacteria bacterium]|tara:strand:+ start:377 stop:580 length:204 start_codon:yes stop_codon:yes gene_type:complete